MDLVFYFIAAFIGGFISTVPPGPLNMKLLILYIREEKNNLIAFQFGIILADILYSIFAIMLVHKTYETDLFISFEKKYLFFVQLMFIIMLTILGIIHIKSAKNNHSKSKTTLQELNSKNETNSKIMRHFLGVVGTLTIPSLMPFWYLWWMGQNFTSKQPICFIAISIALGVYFGDFLIFKAYRFLTNHFHEKYLRTNISKIELWVGYLFLAIAFIFFIKMFLF